MDIRKICLHERSEGDAFGVFHQEADSFHPNPRKSGARWGPRSRAQPRGVRNDNFVKGGAVSRPKNGCGIENVVPAEPSSAASPRDGFTPASGRSLWAGSSNLSSDFLAEGPYLDYTRPNRDASVLLGWGARPTNAKHCRNDRPRWKANTAIARVTGAVDARPGSCARPDCAPARPEK